MHFKIKLISFLFQDKSIAHYGIYISHIRLYCPSSLVIHHYIMVVLHYRVLISASILADVGTVVKNMTSAEVLNNDLHLPVDICIEKNEETVEVSKLGKVEIARKILLIILTYLVLISAVSLTDEPALTKRNNSKRIAMVIPFGGVLPKYSKHFLNSLNSSAIDIFFVSVEDNPLLRYQYKNIHQIYLPIGFNAFISQQLCIAYNCTAAELPLMTTIVKNQLTNLWKLCIFRPMYAFVFRKYLKDYNYVAWADIDTIWSNNIELLLMPYLTGFDIVTVAADPEVMHYLRGQFTALYNRERVICSFMEAFPKSDFFLKFADTNKFLAEEGIYSKYMIDSEYSVLTLPFQAADWTECKPDALELRNGTLICTLYIAVGPIPNMNLVEPAENVTIQVNLSDEPAYRVVVNTHFGIVVSHSMTMKVYKFSDAGKYFALRFPLFYHFQTLKDNFQIQDKSFAQTN